MGFYLDPIEQQSGGSLPATGGFQLDPLEQQSGGSLPPTGAGFQTSPLEQISGGSLPPTTRRYGSGAPATPASSYGSIFEMFFGE